MPESHNAEREEFLRHFPVSHETVEKLDHFAKLLAEWNGKFNLVAASTLPHIWQRHFLDSAQLIKFIPKTTGSVADLGSGAGFPGLVLGIVSPGPEIHLIESTGKKANFLRAVIEDLDLKATVHQARIEGFRSLKFDVIAVRALKPLPELLNLSKPLMTKNSFCLLLKGQRVDVELTEATKYWRFKSEKFPSLSDPSGTVLKISELHNVAHRKAGRGRDG